MQFWRQVVVDTVQVAVQALQVALERLGAKALPRRMGQVALQRLGIALQGVQGLLVGWRAGESRQPRRALSEGLRVTGEAISWADVPASLRRRLRHWPARASAPDACHLTTATASAG